MAEYTKTEEDPIDIEKLARRMRRKNPVLLDECKNSLDDMIFEMAKIQCTTEEIASIIGWSKESVSRKYAELIKNSRKAGHASLRRKQWKQAGGSYVMAIWLGKQYLDQVEPLPRINTQDTNAIMRFLDMHDKAYVETTKKTKAADKKNETVEEAVIVEKPSA